MANVFGKQGFEIKRADLITNRVKLLGDELNVGI